MLRARAALGMRCRNSTISSPKRAKGSTRCETSTDGWSSARARIALRRRCSAAGAVAAAFVTPASRSVPTTATRARRRRRSRRADAPVRAGASATAPAAVRRRLARRQHGRRRPAGSADAGHHRAHPDRHSGFPRRRSASSPPTSPTSSRPISSARACSSRSTAASFLEQVARRQRRAALPRLARPSAPTRWSSAMSRAAPDGRIVARVPPVGRRSRAGSSPASASPTSAQNWRRVGHIIADQVYEQLTGEKGYFDTRVVFVDETGPKDSASSASPSWTRTAPTCGC